MEFFGNCWTKLTCVIIGHSANLAVPEDGVASAWKCSRCTHEEPAIVWPRSAKTQQ